jgi:hypothetical protein
VFKIFGKPSVYIVFAIAIIGCAEFNSNNQGVPTNPSDSILTPSKTPSAVLFNTPSFEALTPDNNVATSKPNYLCEKVPEPELNNKTDSGNIYLAGKFFLCTYDGTQSAFDFDTGELDSTQSLAVDIRIIISSASIDNRSLYFFQETNNSYVAVSESDSPTQEHCEKQSAAENRLTLILGSVGATGCVLTNEGRLAFFKVEQLDPFGLESVEISFTTWNKK